jgi:hypothetical protein
MCPSSEEITVSMLFCLVYLFLFSICFEQPCAHHQEKLLYLCDTGIFLSVLLGSGLQVAVSLQPADQIPPIHSDKYQCRIDTVISPDDGHMVARNMLRREINILSRIVDLVGFICRIESTDFCFGRSGTVTLYDNME